MSHLDFLILLRKRCGQQVMSDSNGLTSSRLSEELWGLWFGDYPLWLIYRLRIALVPSSDPRSS